MTKKELLDRLAAAGVEGYTMGTPKAELEDAVAALVRPAIYDSSRNREHSVKGV